MNVGSYQAWQTTIHSTAMNTETVGHGGNNPIFHVRLGDGLMLSVRQARLFTCGTPTNSNKQPLRVRHVLHAISFFAPLPHQPAHPCSHPYIGVPCSFARTPVWRGRAMGPLCGKTQHTKRARCQADARWSTQPRSTPIVILCLVTITAARPQLITPPPRSWPHPP